VAFKMPEVALQRVIQHGIKNLRANRDAFDDIFAIYTCPEMEASYGQTYIDKIFNWFASTKVPVLQAWSLNPDRVPSISLHLAQEAEDESKAAIGDFWGPDEEWDTNVGAFNVSVDIGIHADKSADHVLWLYYIISYILFREKPLAIKFGLELHTFSASDYNKESKYLAENVYSRWIRYRCTVLNGIPFGDFTEIDSVDVDVNFSQTDDEFDVNVVP